MTEFLERVLTDIDREYNDQSKPFVRIGKDHLMIQFMSGMCSWKKESGGCSFCTFEQRCYKENPDYMEQLEHALNEARKKVDINEVEYLLLFNRSFFDDKEISPESRKEILERANQLGVSRICVESRPGFITEKKLETSKNTLQSKDFDIYLGVESTNDFLRKHCHHKGMERKVIKRAIEMIKEFGFNFIPYLMVKPPFVNEKLCIEDTVKSIERCVEWGAERISIQVMHIYRNSLAYDMLKLGIYETPWLWSLSKILKNVSEVKDRLEGFHGLGEKKLTQEPVELAGNCGECDEEFIKALNEKRLEFPDCNCKSDWKSDLEKSGNALEKIKSDFYRLSEEKNIPLKKETLQELDEDYEMMFKW